jgi:Holliday junction DNA helicase RuvB
MTMDQPNLDVGSFTPTSLNHIIGQRTVVDQVAVALEASFADGKKFDHALLVGASGCGKSALATVIGREMAANVHEVLAQSIEGPADLNAVLLRAKDKDVVFLDEAHMLSKDHQTALYLALDKRTVYANGPKSVQAIPLADFTLLLASTDEYAILEPLRDRCRLLLRFQHYANDDLTLIVRHRAKALAWEVTDEVPPLIAARARGTPRLALRLLQACRRVCRADGEWLITHRHLERACQLENLDRLGLGPVEQQYLRLVSDRPLRLNVLASLLGLPARTVSHVTEPTLIRLGLVTKDNSGRRLLAPRGHEHLSQLREHDGDKPMEL